MVTARCNTRRTPARPPPRRRRRPARGPVCRMHAGYESSFTKNAVKRTAPSTIHVSHQMETLEVKRVSQPAPFTPPSTTLRSNAPSARPAAFAQAVDEQKVVELVHVPLVVEQRVQRLERASPAHPESPACRCRNSARPQIPMIATATEKPISPHSVDAECSPSGRLAGEANTAPASVSNPWKPTPKPHSLGVAEPAYEHAAGRQQRRAARSWMPAIRECAWRSPAPRATSRRTSCSSAATCRRPSARR